MEQLGILKNSKSRSWQTACSTTLHEPSASVFNNFLKKKLWFTKTPYSNIMLFDLFSITYFLIYKSSIFNIFSTINLYHLRFLPMKYIFILSRKILKIVWMSDLYFYRPIFHNIGTNNCNSHCETIYRFLF